ncbi:MAG: hypothetical protein QOF75_2886 [Gaiellaceae bacterium]|nr:hypothetical protein [Gaiellaceae bacterium]
MTFLTPLGGLAALAVLLPLAAWAMGRRRTDVVRRALRLPAPAGRLDVRTLAGAIGVVALGLAAAQPALTHDTRLRERTGTQALFVFDTSRSMAASATSASPTRLDRAVAAATRLRGAISDVPSGIATLTDRVLPDLDPVSDVASFDAVAERAVAIESPPPAATAVRATTFSALRDIAAGNYFDPKATRRLVVVLTDGESGPVDGAALARALPPARGYRFVAVRFWQSNEAVYDSNGKPETAYRPDPLGRVVLDGVAAALGGRAFDERQLAAASSYLRSAEGNGPTTAAPAAAPTRTPLAPYLAGLALLLVAVALVPSVRAPRIDSAVR